MTPTEPWGGVYWHTNTFWHVTRYKHSRPTLSNIHVFRNYIHTFLLPHTRKHRRGRVRRERRGSPSQRENTPEALKWQQPMFFSLRSQRRVGGWRKGSGWCRCDRSDERISWCSSTGVNIPLEDKRGKVRRSSECFSTERQNLPKIPIIPLNCTQCHLFVRLWRVYSQ